MVSRKTLPLMSARGGKLVKTEEKVGERKTIKCQIYSGLYSIYIKLLCSEWDLNVENALRNVFRWSIRYYRTSKYTIKIPMVDYILKGKSFEEMIEHIVSSVKKMAKRNVKFYVDGCEVYESEIADKMVRSAKKYEILRKLLEKTRIIDIIKGNPVIVEKVLYDPVGKTFAIVLKLTTKNTRAEKIAEELAKRGYRRVGRRLVSPEIRVGKENRAGEEIILHG